MGGESGNSKGFDVRSSAIFTLPMVVAAACTNTGSKVGEDARSAEKAPSHVARTGDQEFTDGNGPAPPPITSAGACRTQDGGELPETRLRAVGTEPFWGAEVDGRCVRYSTPENPRGTRVWTHYDASARRWVGALYNKPFKLTIETHEGCSDGMSDRSFPLAAIVEVDGEQRRGCAEPL
jgi:uncharacterized membrane protein